MRWLIVACAVLAAGAAQARQREYLTDISGSPVTTEGGAAEIAAKGRRCIAETLGSGRAGGELIVSDSDNVIVARSVSTYSDRLVRWQIRSRLTFEARDGRFRIQQSGLERFNEMSGGWSPIGKWRGSGWERAQQAFEATADAIRSCVNSTTQNDDW